MTRPVYCDEDVWIPVADGLRQRGWEIHTARQHDRLGDTDREQLAFAAENDWLLLTFDDDFLGLIESERLEHRGVIYTNQTGKRIGDVVKAVDTYLDGLNSDTVGVQYL